MHDPVQTKRIILCCDGSWADSDDGYTSPTLIPYNPKATLQVPTNVTRISRALRKTGLDGKPQITSYYSGVGTDSGFINSLAGGIFGAGISNNIREAYSFIAANYRLGDEIILIGFSRGAFTARSIAGIIHDIGLLTREGMDCFYPIFKDQENFKNEHYHDIFPDLPFPNKPKGPGVEAEYRQRLEKEGLTRVNNPDGSRISIQAIAVWDTVGSLGIPQIPLLTSIGLPRSLKEYKFYDTELEGNTKHAFQALALDEHRGPFVPALWERIGEDIEIDLRQVWFPGVHKNVGGGYADQEIGNITLAWMMDQLASIGVAFLDEYVDRIFAQNLEFYKNPPKPGFLSRTPDEQWAVESVYNANKPIRPFGLGKIYESHKGIYHFAGSITRTPGLYQRLHPDTGRATGVPMTNTNERIHSSVRIRLQLEGLGRDDRGPYKCEALTKNGPWKLRQKKVQVDNPIPSNAAWGGGEAREDPNSDELQWVWEYAGPEENAPQVRTLIEDNLGPYQRKLLQFNHK